jgi:hypothetical protein
MKQQLFTGKVVRTLVVVGIAAIFAPVAHAQGGAVSHVYASPPLDAGSSVPNPDYAYEIRTESTRPDDRANRAIVHGTQTEIVVRSTADGFDWADAGIGAAGTLAVLLVAGSGLGIQRSRQRTASA